MAEPLKRPGRYTSSIASDVEALADIAKAVPIVNYSNQSPWMRHPSVVRVLPGLKT
jgi:hypothetical protein